MKRSREYDNETVQCDGHYIQQLNNVSFLTPITVSLRKRVMMKTKPKPTNHASSGFGSRKRSKDIIKEDGIVINSKKPEPDVPIVKKVTYDTCWCCYRAKPRGLRQVCSTCVLKLHKHSIKRHTRRRGKNKTPFVCFSCNQCKIVVRHKTDLPSTCVHSLFNTVPESWSCSCCEATYSTVGKVATHFLTCYKPGGRASKRRNKKVVMFDTNNAEKSCDVTK